MLFSMNREVQSLNARDLCAGDSKVFVPVSQHHGGFRFLLGFASRFVSTTRLRRRRDLTVDSKLPPLVRVRGSAAVRSISGAIPCESCFRHSSRVPSSCAACNLVDF